MRYANKGEDAYRPATMTEALEIIELLRGEVVRRREERNAAADQLEIAQAERDFYKEELEKEREGQVG